MAADPTQPFIITVDSIFPPLHPVNPSNLTCTPHAADNPGQNVAGTLVYNGVPSAIASAHPVGTKITLTP